jgi:hypothetical protein
MNTNAILIWIPPLAVLVAIVSLIVQTSRSKFALKVELLLKLDDRFSSDSFKALRRAAARSIKTHTYDDAEEILDFFTLIGLLVRRRALDPELVWHAFFYWIHNYGTALKPYINEAQRKDSTVWNGFVYLHKQVTEVEKSERKCSDADLGITEKELEEFIRTESTIK